MSHTAIAAVLGCTDLSMGERLVALSLASFANREQRAWPGNSAAAARAGLGRSRYLEARERLVARGLIGIEATGCGRGQTTTLIVLFAQSGPWWDGDINARLLEQVLTHSQVRGPARLLLATLAALADDSGLVDELSTADLCRAAGLADSTYRRARLALLASGEVALFEDGGGRGRLNRWRVAQPSQALGAAPTGQRRRAPVPRQLPLLSPVRSQPIAGAGSGSGAGAVAARSEKGPGLSGVSVGKGPDVSGVSPRKRPDLTGVSGGNPAKTPPETPPPNARGGRESLNPGTRNPPNPPHGGSQSQWATIDESYVSDRGRRRRRSVRIDLHEVHRALHVPTAVDRNDWQQIRHQLRRSVDESTFAIWLEPIELTATDQEQRLVVAAPASTAAWTSQRYRRLLTAVATHVGRDLRFATEAERQALEPHAVRHAVPTVPKEAAG